MRFNLINGVLSRYFLIDNEKIKRWSNLTSSYFYQQMIFLIVHWWCSIWSMIVLSQRIDNVWDCIICIRKTIVDQMKYHRWSFGDLTKCSSLFRPPKIVSLPKPRAKGVPVIIGSTLRRSKF
jgi:hypothetical protein